MLEDTFKKTIEKYGLLKKKDKLILGISGGPDSVCLLHQLLAIAKDYKLKIVCAHLNHSLRKEADAEERFIKKTCEGLGIRCISEKKDVGKLFKGDSLEQTARNLRLDFFLRCSRQLKIKKLALAHHKDDLVETILMRLIRGSGLKGLRGFLPQTRFKELKVIRPMIELSKNEIVSWLKKRKLGFCIDKSNFQDKFFRNRIRLKLMPLLKELNPNIVDSLYNLGSNISLDYDFLYQVSYEKFLNLKRKEALGGLRLDLKGLKQLPLALFNNVLRIALHEAKGNSRRLEAKHLDELRELVFKRPQASIVDLPYLVAKKEDKTLLIQSLIL
jgi:tRNA(Ile)-lysidine synthase